jgi:hypothetical protein
LRKAKHSKNISNNFFISDFFLKFDYQLKKLINMAQDYQKTQDSIVRQSSIKWTIDYLRMIGTPLPIKEVIGIANVVCDYCQNGYTKEMGERLDKIDQHIQSKFEEV